MDHVNVTQFWRAIDNISIKYKGLLPQTLSIGGQLRLGLGLEVVMRLSDGITLTYQIIQPRAPRVSRTLVIASRAVGILPRTSPSQGHGTPTDSLR
eukprot:582818-Amorphochlora_amoeboformis.AAC.1